MTVWGWLFLVLSIGGLVGMIFFPALRSWYGVGSAIFWGALAYWSYSSTEAPPPMMGGRRRRW
jgi:hypothetical protein